MGEEDLISRSATPRHRSQDCERVIVITPAQLNKMGVRTRPAQCGSAQLVVHGNRFRAAMIDNVRVTSWCYSIEFAA